MMRNVDEIVGDVSMILAADPSSELLTILEPAAAGDPAAMAALTRFRGGPWILPVLATHLTRLLQASDTLRAQLDATVGSFADEARARTAAHHAVIMLRAVDRSIADDLDAAIAVAISDLPEVQEAKIDFDAHPRSLGTAVEFERLLGGVLCDEPQRMVVVNDAAARAAAETVVFRWRGDDSTSRAQLSATLHWMTGSHTEISDPLVAFARDPAVPSTSDMLVRTLSTALTTDTGARSMLLGSYDVGRRIQRAARESTGQRDAQADGGSDTPIWTVYPLLRPEGVDPDADFSITANRSFTLEVGIGADIDFSLAATGGLGDVAAGTPITIHLAYDPLAFLIEGNLPVVVTPKEDDPFPTETVKVTPLGMGSAGGPNRRIAAHYLIDDSLRGMAFRSFRVAGTERAPAATGPSHLDLASLAEEEPPDVIVAIYRADAVTAGTYFVAVFPRKLDGPLPPAERIELKGTTGVYMSDMYAEAETDSDPFARYLKLTGRATDLGAKFPPSTRTALRAIAASATKRRPATMLLLTDDNLVPWELAAFPKAEAMASPAGGSSPFLGSHFAIGRWPIEAQSGSTKRPDAEPIDVRRVALVTADYADEVDGWKPLPDALKEVAGLAKFYGSAEIWQPVRNELLRNLAEDVDVLHFALHGKYDPRDDQDGLVLIEERNGIPSAAFVGSTILRGRMLQNPPLLPRRPFVFLNACQVGRSQQMLGDYGGLAAVFLEAGARGVVACLWNIEDDVAGTISKEFYRSADKLVPPAEILRRVRTRYVVTDDTSQGKTPSPTLIAYQYYGHPNLRFSRQK